VVIGVVILAVTLPVSLASADPIRITAGSMIADDSVGSVDIQGKAPEVVRVLTLVARHRPMTTAAISQLPAPLQYDGSIKRPPSNVMVGDRRWSDRRRVRNLRGYRPSALRSRLARPGQGKEGPLLDRFMPEYEVAERHHIRVAAPVPVTLKPRERWTCLRSRSCGRSLGRGSCSWVRA
jgi:hypothetical protein